jgi:mono/diheme cytochrome c family protein
MHRSVLLVAGSFLMCATSFNVQAQRIKNSTEVISMPEAHRLFQQNCAPCHAPNGLGPPLRAAMVAGVENAIKVTILEGGDRMPGFQYTLSPTQVDAIITYMKTVQVEPMHIDTSIDESYGYPK